MDRGGYFLAALFGFLLTSAPLFAQAVVATIPVGMGPQAIALAPDGKRAYVGNSASDTVSVIDLAERKAIATVNVGRAVRGIAVT
ncbi:MAG: YncE family protein, partial [Methylocella sp.]